MSTIYTFHTECSTMDTLASTDELLCYDASTGRTVSTTPADIATYINSNPGTFTGATLAGATNFTGGVNMSVSSSILIGTTLSAKVGFWGAAGTSRRVGATQATITITVTATSCGVGFTSTGAVSTVVEYLNEIRSVLVDAGIMKGAA